MGEKYSIVCFSSDNNSEEFFIIGAVTQLEQSIFKLLIQADIINDKVKISMDPKVYVVKCTINENNVETYDPPTKKEFNAVIDNLKILSKIS